MGIFDWLFKTKEKLAPAAQNVTLSIRTERVDPEPIEVENFIGEIAGEKVKAEIPIKEKVECERLLRKRDRTNDENEFLYNNYWINVYYKGIRHGYHGLNDYWTYTARDLPEIPQLHEWIYKILGKNKLSLPDNISTVTSWDDSGTIYVKGQSGLFIVQVYFKPRGFILNFALNDDNRYENKASFNKKDNEATFNIKTGETHFPFYYSDAQSKIIEWGKTVKEEMKSRTSQPQEKMKE